MMTIPIWATQVTRNFVISCATHVGFSVAPSLTCTCALALLLHYIPTSAVGKPYLLHLLLSNTVIKETGHCLLVPVYMIIHE